MRTKTILTVLAIGLILSAYGQKSTIKLTFTAENNGQYFPLDSIFIENLTQGGDTTLYAPDTILVLDYVTSIENNEDIGKNTFSVSQNYPNPFMRKTTVNLYLQEKEHIKITVLDILSREMAQYENTLNRGNHSFAFYSSKKKYYLLTVIGKQTSKTIKMLNANSNTTYGGKCKIVYNEYEDNVIGFKSQKAINNFVFNIGDELKYTAYSDIGETSIIDSPTGNQTYTFQYAIGIPCPGTPTVTDIDGNVYNTVLFGSQCWMAENLKTTTYSNNTPIPNVTVGLNWGSLTTGAYVWYDNDISWKNIYGAMYNWYAVNDSNSLCPSGWHVPSDDEWTALTNFIGGNGSPNGNKLKSCRQVGSPLGGNCNTIAHPRWNQDNTHYGTDDYGFSCLPGGYRFGPSGTFGYVGEYGLWWSSSGYSSVYAWCRYLHNESGSVYMDLYSKQSGYSVRCLKD